MKLSLHLPFIHRVCTLRNKNWEDNFFGDENQFVYNFNSPKLGQLETKWTENLTLSTVWDADANGQEAQTEKNHLTNYFLL